MEQKHLREEIKVSGERLVSRLRALLHEGNVRHITVKNEKGRVLFEFPLTLGVVGVLLLPTASAIGAIAALLGNCTILVERID